MSKLQKTLDALAAQEIDVESRCFSINQHAPAIVVEATGGRRWVLPWVHLLNAQHDDDGKGETLLLCFVTHEVVVNGRHLSSLVEDVARLRLEVLRGAPHRYAQSVDDEPFIGEIHVRATAKEATAEKSPKTRGLS